MDPLIMIKQPKLRILAALLPASCCQLLFPLDATIDLREPGQTQLLVEWPSRTGITYTVESSAHLGQFNDAASGLQPTPPMNQWWVDIGASGSAAFYRVKAQGPLTSGDRAAAHALNQRLGRGNNFMASKAINGQGAPEDYALLNRVHFNHCRIGYKMDERAGPAPDHIIPASDMTTLQNMVDWCLAEGLIAIVDPVHNWANGPGYTDNAADRNKLQKIWEQVAAHFAAYDLENVVFEIMNEPNGGDNVTAITQIGLAAIRGVPGNEQRIVIVSGDGFSTRQALIDAFDNDEIPSDDDYLIATFHYYDPRPFTKQGDNPDVSWGSSAEFAQTGSDFDEVIAANNAFAARHGTEPLPVYCGEFGVDNEADNWNDDRERWLSWIRMQAEARGFSWAHWSMYNNTDGAKGMGPWNDDEKNDPSLRVFDPEPLEALIGRYEFEDGSRGGAVSWVDTFPGFTGTGYASFPQDTGFGTWARADSIYIPKSDTYVVNIHYSSAVDRTVRLVTGAEALTDVLFPATGGPDSWDTLRVKIAFNASTSADLDNESLKVVALPDPGPNLDWVHITAPSP